MADAIADTLDASSNPQGRERAMDFAQDRIAQQYLQVLLPDYGLPTVEH
jgi:hypothetical protein